MNTQTAPKTETQTAPPAPKSGEVAVFQRPRLPWHDQIEKSFGDIGVTKSTWKALIDAVFPAAKSIDSVILALSYCKARKLDPFKRPVHIVPVWDKDKRGYTDTVWPGISEIRTTAVRTGNFAGTDPAVFGPDVTRTFTGETGRDQNRSKKEITLIFPEWAQVTVYRMIDKQRVAIAGPRVYWEETYATIGQTELPNAMWERRKRGQLEKCAEAAALRRAFPEELGSEYTADEAHYSGTIIEALPTKGPVKQALENTAQSLDQFVEQQTEHDPETGEVAEQQTEDGDDAGEAAGETQTDQWDDYLSKMLAEFAAAKKPKDKDDFNTTFRDTIVGAVERKDLTEARANVLLQAWQEKTGTKSKMPTPPNGNGKK